uniref:uncharacterized protein LOC122606511 n=1 Tax=Erigeron canadensis TaxID=72917 RepID=UPI001CB984F3|nr:uncharacterized protein LOC122606511 [Erigeron canadensis]
MPQKRLLRLPHVFGKILELPLQSNADVLIQDKLDCIRFVAKVDKNVFEGEVKAYAIKIYPGVTKVVVRGGGDKRNVELLLEKMEDDVWRFRLAESTRPELATAVFVGKELVVTIPKGGRGGTEVFDGFSVDDGMGVRGVGRRGKRVFMKEK